MKVQVISAAAARSWVWEQQGLDLGSPAHLADELRAHVVSLGTATRASLVRRVTRLLSPLGPLEEARVDEVCRALERRGDVLSGPRGRVAPAPLRLVETHGDRWLVVGSLPTVELRRLLPGGDVSVGVGRTARIPSPDRAALAESVASDGGRLLSAEEWAGLSRTPVADAGWLEELAQRLSNQGEAASAGLTTRWDDLSIYTSAPGGAIGRRWQKPAPAGGTASAADRLCRARQAGGWSAYGWGAPPAPNEPPRRFLPLSRDEARRTEYAIDRAAGAPSTWSAALEEGLWWVTLDRPLPAAEYRFLLAMADDRREDAWPVRLGFPAEGWGRAAAMLEERLGVRVVSNSGV